ncbi:MAG TPA: hypothetical protein VN961_16200, partial [Streptosporangiaceae bacterium]|nr:hypothetical protein [Streptosporangiaceae bacterium]
AQPMLSGPGSDDRAVSYLPMAHIVERYVSHYGAMFAGVQVTPPVACRDIASTPPAHRVLAW